MIEKGDLILAPSPDHGYRVVDPYYTQVVWNMKYNTYSDYVCQEYMSDDEKIVTAWVVE